MISTRVAKEPEIRFYFNNSLVLLAELIEVDAIRSAVQGSAAHSILSSDLRQPVDLRLVKRNAGALVLLTHSQQLVAAIIAFGKLLVNFINSQ